MRSAIDLSRRAALKNSSSWLVMDGSAIRVRSGWKVNGRTVPATLPASLSATSVAANPAYVAPLNNDLTRTVSTRALPGTTARIKRDVFLPIFTRPLPLR